MNNQFILIATLIFNTLVALLISILVNNLSLGLLLFISHSIGLSIMTSNIFIVADNYSQNMVKIIIHSLVGFALGIVIAFIGSRLIFDIVLSYTVIYVGLFFGIIAIIIAWLYLNRIENQEALDKIKQKLSRGNNKYLLWIKASNPKGVVFLINVTDIKYFKSQDKYTSIYTQDKEYLISITVKELSAQLNPDYFWKIHRGTIVNLAFISKISKNDDNQLTVYLEDGGELSVSRNHNNLFKKM